MCRNIKITVINSQPRSQPGIEVYIINNVNTLIGMCSNYCGMDFFLIQIFF